MVYVGSFADNLMVVMGLDSGNGSRQCRWVSIMVMDLDSDDGSR